MLQSIHRNLNLARKNPRQFVWILSNPTNKAGTFTPGTKGKKVDEIFDRAFVINDFELQVNTNTAKKINNGGHRDVCAYARGDVSFKYARHNPSEMFNHDAIQKQRITINMIQKGKADKITGGVGRGELCFVWAHNHKPCLTKGKLIYADSTGMYILDKGLTL